MGRSAPKIKYSPNSRCRPSSCLLAVLANFLENRNISSMRRSVSSPDETEESSKYNAQRSIFDKLRSISSGDETVCRMLDITSQTNDFTRRS